MNARLGEFQQKQCVRNRWLGEERAICRVDLAAVGGWRWIEDSIESANQGWQMLAGVNKQNADGACTLFFQQEASGACGLFHFMSDVVKGMNWCGLRIDGRGVAKHLH